MKKAISILFFLLTACGVPKHRFLELEKRVDESERKIAFYVGGNPKEEIRYDSLNSSLSRVEERLNKVMPANAQWLKLQKAGTIKWYLGEEGQNAYVQFIEGDLEGRRVMVNLQTRAGNTRNWMSPGDAVEHVWDAPSPKKSFIVTFHKMKFVEQEAWGLFSITYGDTEQ